MLARRAVLAGLTAVGLSRVSVCAAEATQLRIAYQKSGPLVVLRQQRRLETGLAAQRGIQWIEFQSGPPLLEAMNAGSADFGATGDTPPIFAQAAGVDLVYVAYQPTPGLSSAILVHADAPVHSVADLKGRRIAFTRGSSAHYQTVRLLVSAGLSLADVQPVYMQPADAAAAFRAGSIDAWTIWDPFYAVAEREPGVRVLVNAATAPSNSFFLARRDFAEREPQTVAFIVSKIADVGHWCEQHQDELARVMSEITGVDIAAQRVAAARGDYNVDFITDAVLARQQEVADTFASLRILPHPIDVRRAAWFPPTATARAIGSKTGETR